MPGCLTEPSPLRLGAKIDLGVEEFGDERAERIGLGKSRKLVAEFEVFQDVLHVRREAVEVGVEVGQKLLLAGAGLQIAEGEFGSVVKRLFGGVAQRGVLLGDAGLVEHLLGFKHGFLGRLQDSVKTAQAAHGQNDIGILAALEQVAEDVVSDAPDERDYFVMGGLIHYGPWNRGLLERGRGNWGWSTGMNDP